MHTVNLFIRNIIIKTDILFKNIQAFAYAMCFEQNVGCLIKLLRLRAFYLHF